MGIIRSETLKKLKEIYSEGIRVKLVKMDDKTAPPVGTYGTVTGVDDLGTIHVHWDNGSCLGAAYGEDVIEKVIFNDYESLTTYVEEEYVKYDTEFSSGFLSFEVNMPKKDILKAYGELQAALNGDIVLDCVNGKKYRWYDTQFARDMTEVYSGRMDKFLEQFNGSERFVRYYDADTKLDFIL